MIVEEDLADHIDLNFGCPVPKVTRKGGGAALPWRIDALRRHRALRPSKPPLGGAGHGQDAARHRRRPSDLPRSRPAGAGRRGDICGPARADGGDFYGGHARWGPIAELADLLDIPVLGNGDIWEAEDALRMVAETGCAGVVVGRGCLGRPWLFADLAAAFTGRAERVATRSAAT